MAQFMAVVNPRTAEVLSALGWQEGRDYVITPDLDLDAMGECELCEAAWPIRCVDHVVEDW